MNSGYPIEPIYPDFFNDAYSVGKVDGQNISTLSNSKTVGLYSDFNEDVGENSSSEEEEESWKSFRPKDNEYNPMLPQMDEQVSKMKKRLKTEMKERHKSEIEEFHIHYNLLSQKMDAKEEVLKPDGSLVLSDKDFNEMQKQEFGRLLLRHHGEHLSLEKSFDDIRSQNRIFSPNATPNNFN